MTQQSLGIYPTHSGDYQVSRQEALTYHSRHFSILFESQGPGGGKFGDIYGWNISVVAPNGIILKQESCADYDVRTYRDRLIFETYLNLDVA